MSEVGGPFFFFFAHGGETKRKKKPILLASEAHLCCRSCVGVIAHPDGARVPATVVRGGRSGKDGGGGGCGIGG